MIDFIQGERSELLESLASVQVDPSLIAGLESLSSAQTKGVKRQLVEESHSLKIMQTQGSYNFLFIRKKFLYGMKCLSFDCFL